MNVELHYSERIYIRALLMPYDWEPPWVNPTGFWIEHHIGKYRIPVAPPVGELHVLL